MDENENPCEMSHIIHHVQSFDVSFTSNCSIAIGSGYTFECWPLTFSFFFYRLGYRSAGWPANCYTNESTENVTHIRVLTFVIFHRSIYFERGIEKRKKKRSKCWVAVVVQFTKRFQQFSYSFVHSFIAIDLKWSLCSHNQTTNTINCCVSTKYRSKRKISRTTSIYGFR